MDNIMQHLTPLIMGLYALRIATADGSEAIRIYKVEGSRLVKVLEFYMDELSSKIFKLRRAGLSLSVQDIQNLISIIMEKHPSMQVIPYAGESPGWWFGSNGKPLGYAASEVVDDKGNTILSDPENQLLSQKGSQQEWVTGASRFIKDNILLQMLLLHSMAAIVTGLLGLQTLIVSIIGKARSGKTTVAQFMQSVYTCVNDSKLSLNFNATDYYLMSCLNGIVGGGCVLIDDGSLNCRKRNFQDLIYSLASNKSVGRLIKNECSKVYTWCTSIVLTAEQSIMFNGSNHKDFNAELEGFAARNCEVMVSEETLMSSAGEANEMQAFVREQFGTAGMAIVKYILQNSLADNLKDQYNNELKRIRSEIESDQIMQSVAENVAAICVTADIASKALGLEFDIREVEEYMLSIFRTNLEEYRDMKNDNETLKEVYPILVELGTTVYTGYQKDGDICIPAAKFTAFIQEMNYKPNVVKKELFNAGLLVRDIGYTTTINHNGRSMKVVRIKNTLNKNSGEVA